MADLITGNLIFVKLINKLSSAPIRSTPSYRYTPSSSTRSSWNATKPRWRRWRCITRRIRTCSPKSLKGKKSGASSWISRDEPRTRQGESNYFTLVLSIIATCSLQQADERSRQQPPAGGEGAEQGEQSPAQAGAGAARPHRQVGAGAGQGVPGRGNKLRRLHRQPGKTSKTAGDLTDLSILQKEEHLQGLETEKLAREKAKKENLLHETRFGAKPSTPAKLKGESVSSLWARVILYNLLQL